MPAAYSGILPPGSRNDPADGRAMTTVLAGKSSLGDPARSPPADFGDGPVGQGGPGVCLAPQNGGRLA